MKAVILVGHGGVPSDFPPKKVQRLVALEKMRTPTTPMGEEEAALDYEIRHWPRDANNDRYKIGVEQILVQLQKTLPSHKVVEAYNEFCAPTIEVATKALVKDGIKEITVISTMLTPGGSHSDSEMPEIVDKLKLKYPHVRIQYAWPFELSAFAGLLADQVKRFEAA